MTTFAEATKNVETKTIPTFDGICYQSSTITGAVIRTDEGRTFGAKRTDEARVDAGFAGCAFRLGLAHHEIAINIRITGRTIQFRNNADAGWVRCEIEYVGDYEPSTFARAWLRVW